MPEASQDLRRRVSIWSRIHIDPPLLLFLSLLTALGLVVLYSAANENIYYFKRQAQFFVMAYALMFITAQFSLYVIQRWAYWFYAFVVFLLVLVIFYGSGAKGAQRWLDVGITRFQPADLMKLALPIAVCAYLAAGHLPPKFKHVFWSLVSVAIPVGLIYLQPDLTTSALVAVPGIAALFLAGLRWRFILSALGVGLASIWPIWQFGLHEYQKNRVLTLLNPDADKLGSGWNSIQAKTAIGSGGVEGKGWLLGTQSHLDFLPESHTDFAIAVLAEEFGLFGVLILISLYLLIIGRGFMIALNAQDTFGRLLAGSITLTFFIYVFVNMGMVSGLLPIAGVPLPLVSYGGTALLTIMMGFGLLMAVSTEQKRVTI
jgi:rod shape determining protein RodA